MGTTTKPSFALPQGITVREVGPALIELHLQVMGQGWGTRITDALRSAFHSSFQESPRLAWHFMAFSGEEPVGTCSLAAHDDYGYLLGAQVLAKGRGAGAYKHLIAARLRFLQEAGIEYAVTQAMEQTSAPILEHLGFETLFHCTTYRLEP
jgi:GNAT superfamily N-acetyltransferase